MNGQGDQVSGPIQTHSGWQIQWQTDGESFSVAVTGDQKLGTIINHPGPASGVISIGPSGTFKLEVKAKGPWKITVRQPPT